MSRTAFNSRELEESLAARGIPYTIEGGSSFFSRPEVQAPLALLALCANPQVNERNDFCSCSFIPPPTLFLVFFCVPASPLFRA